MVRRTYTIVVVGLWHLGEVYSAGLAELRNRVIGIDSDAETVRKLQEGEPPVAEPDLVQLLQKHIAAGHLSYTSDFSRVREGDAVWLAFDTPVDEKDEADERVIFKAINRIAPFLKKGTLIICSSQLRAGGTRKIEELLRKKRPKLRFRVAYVPENLQLGKALTSFMKPSRIVAGVRDDGAFSELSRIFRPLKTTLLRMSPESAEMSKHALNSFLATSLSFIYDIADICEAVGADVRDVARALRSDSRIGAAAYLDASIGFSGGTLGRDLKALCALGKNCGARVPVIKSVWEKNHTRRAATLARIRRILGTLRGKTVGFLGVTYKPGTPTLRSSLALELASLFLKEGASVRAADPGAQREDMAKRAPEIAFFREASQMAEGCHAILLVTAWPEFRSLDPAALAKVMRKPRLFFDARNVFAGTERTFTEAGLLYVGVGRGKL